MYHSSLPLDARVRGHAAELGNSTCARSASAEVSFCPYFCAPKRVLHPPHTGTALIAEREHSLKHRPARRAPPQRKVGRGQCCRALRDAVGLRSAAAPLIAGPWWPGRARCLAANSLTCVTRSKWAEAFAPRRQCRVGSSSFSWRSTRSRAILSRRGRSSSSSRGSACSVGGTLAQGAVARCRGWRSGAGSVAGR